MEWDNHIETNLKKLVKVLFFTKTPPPSQLGGGVMF